MPNRDTRPAVPVVSNTEMNGWSLRTPLFIYPWHKDIASQQSIDLSRPIRRRFQILRPCRPQRKFAAIGGSHGPGV